MKHPGSLLSKLEFIICNLSTVAMYFHSVMSSRYCDTFLLPARPLEAELAIGATVGRAGSNVVDRQDFFLPCLAVT